MWPYSELTVGLLSCSLLGDISGCHSKWITGPDKCSMKIAVIWVMVMSAGRLIGTGHGFPMLADRPSGGTGWAGKIGIGYCNYCHSDYILTFCITSWIWVGAGHWNFSLWKTRPCVPKTGNIMVIADDLVMQGAKASAAMVLIWFIWITRVSTPKGVNSYLVMNLQTLCLNSEFGDV